MSQSRPAARCALAASAIIVASLALSVPAAAAPATPAITHSAPDAALALSVLGSYETGIFDESAAEIVAYYDGRSYTVNAQKAVVDVVDVSDPSTPSLLYSIGATGVANSVAIRDDGLGVVALEAETKTDAGRLLLFDANAESARILGSVEVGALPDMVTISDDGNYAVIANEGEPSEDFDVDPEGSISVVTLPATVAAPTQDAVRTADFQDFEAGGSKTLDPAVRIFGPTPESDLPISRNLEPEYIAVSNGTAYAALQEANAVAVIDLTTASVTEIWPLGYKDHGAIANGLDASDRDPEDGPTANISTYDGLYGAYMPDGISAYTVGGETYLVTANEGDSREWGDFVDAARVKDLGDDGLAPVCATSPLSGATGGADLGRLTVISDLGLSDDGSCYENLYAFGGRSFSIWTTSGELVFDSGDAFERITAEAIPEFFNSNHSESNREGRSDDKGPEPESVTLGEIDGRTYAFVGFERVGGIAVYDVADPAQSSFVTYLNNRDFSVSVEDADAPVAVLSAAGDLGPEGIAFVSAAASPTGEAMLAVGNEVSGTTSYYGIALTAAEGEIPGEGTDGPGDGSEQPGDGADDGEPGAGAGAGDGADGEAGEASDGAASGDDAVDEASGELPYTGADAGLVVVLSALAAAVIAIGTTVLIATRRRAIRR
ncbi:choice-of-anchor I family protein [Paramicrobacterium fandaimingii]|uniref:choice-of-anchor I family protein n=1 Tax=Paramicrobacterium fandaimingii TaxID=2708079 RepID=UPI00141E039F|nr:choice-of-anchor I family protein [Microbacterium fandaimingii]